MEDASVVLGIHSRHLTALQERFLAEPATVGAFDRLTKRAAAAGFDLRVASAFRDYDRQTEIINQKWTGARPVKDVVGLPLLRENVSDLAWLEAILRFSALPGTSSCRHRSTGENYPAVVLARKLIQPLEQGLQPLVGGKHR